MEVDVTAAAAVGGTATAGVGGVFLFLWKIITGQVDSAERTSAEAIAELDRRFKAEVQRVESACLARHEALLGELRRSDTATDTSFKDLWTELGQLRDVSTRRHEKVVGDIARLPTRDEVHSMLEQLLRGIGKGAGAHDPG